MSGSTSSISDSGRNMASRLNSKLASRSMLCYQIDSFANSGVVHCFANAMEIPSCAVVIGGNAEFIARYLGRRRKNRRKAKAKRQPKSFKDILKASYKMTKEPVAKLKFNENWAKPVST